METIWTTAWVLALTWVLGFLLGIGGYWIHLLLLMDMGLVGYGLYSRARYGDTYLDKR